MDQTAERGYFFGYIETLKAYKVFIPGTRSIIYLKFMEDKTYQRSKDLLTTFDHNDLLTKAMRVKNKIKDMIV